MDRDQKPTIKGIFVNSHISAVRKIKGEEGVRELARRFGGSLVFKNSDDVPIRDEVKIIEFALDILASSPVSPDIRAFEAGRLHFKNFCTTPLAKIIFSMFRTDFKLMMLQTKNIAGHVFQGVEFDANDLGVNAVAITMKNNDYPLDHFRGLFTEWLEFSGKKGSVIAKETEPNIYQYTMRWE